VSPRLFDRPGEPERPGDRPFVRLTPRSAAASRYAPRGPRPPASRPLVFAHRGSSYAVPEHTLGAYLRAIEEGADGLECDVRLTRDGHLVCVHDRRLERTSNGRGLVSTHTLAELNELDFGVRRATRVARLDRAALHRGSPGRAGPDGAPPLEPEPLDDDEPVIDRGVSDAGPARILTLNRLLEAALDAGRPVRLLIETKHPTRYGSAVEDRLFAMLHRHGLDQPKPNDPVQVSVMSFSPLAIRRISRLAPLVPTVMLLELLPPGLRSGRLPFGSQIGGPGIALLRTRPEVAVRLHERGHEVYVWTVNEPADLDLVLRLGVEGIITDRPGYVRRRLDSLGRT
jgi:glycerophosphoryl diester phosphodiesterase